MTSFVHRHGTSADKFEQSNRDCRATQLIPSEEDQHPDYPAQLLVSALHRPLEHPAPKQSEPSFREPPCAGIEREMYRYRQRGQPAEAPESCRSPKLASAVQAVTEHQSKSHIPVLQC